MKIERLRKSHKKEIIIGVLVVLGIVATITMTTTKAKYRTTQVLPLVEGEITYTPYDFKIMAMYKSDDGVNYTEITDRMPSSGYVINESKSYCTIDNVNHDTEARLYTNSNGEHVFANLKKIDKCYIWFDKEKNITIDDIIASSNASGSTPTFSNLATTDEGVFKTTDGMYGGTTYYWRGAVINNYVKFAGYCWRIVRINGDKTIRLIYDGSTCHANGTSTTDSIAVTSQAYNSTSNASYYVGWTQNGTQRTNSISATASNAKTQTEKWYSSNITGTNTEKVADGKYCNDRDVTAQPSSWIGTGYATTWSANGTKFAYAGPKRLWESYSPTFSCPTGDIYILKVGLITADEVAFAGGKINANSSYYLYTGQSYWTMSPNGWGSSLASMMYVDSGGSFGNYRVDGTNFGLRPVINLRSDVTFKSGSDGTSSNPYVVE